MLNLLINIVVTMVAWTVQLFAVFTVPVGIVYLVEIDNKTKKRLIYIIVIILTLVGVTMVALFPPVVCPEEYKPYVDDAFAERIRGFNNGLYSLNIPLFPIHIEVTYADERIAEVTTSYFLFGRTKGEIPRNGLPYITGISR